MPLPEVCVCYLLRPGPDGRDQVLLGRKKTGLGQGRLVGPGGKLEPGESPVQAIVREVFEEVGLRVEERDLELRGELEYPFPHTPKWSQKSWVFVCRVFRGEAVASVELEPVWVDVDAIPFGKMWDDARFWLPSVLTGGSVAATFSFAADGRTVERSDHAGFPGVTGGV
jgi:8-oxo-dGTP diphosphatase